LYEVYYDFCRAADPGVARAALIDLARTGVERREDISPEFCESVGAIKAANRISLADCFAIALAGLTGATLLTSDRHEMGGLAKRGPWRISFIR
jgi:predicted nucleic acid-binding protein